MTEPRIVCRFSCGAASAVATKLALAEYGADRCVVTYSDAGSEHPDNARFLADCERWFGVPIVVLKSDTYADTWDVWERERFIMSFRGAPCTGMLKREPAYAFARPDDMLVFGYTAEEEHRAARLRENNFESVILTPLIDRGLTKRDCLAMIDRVGIELPAMYLLGYNNNNCIGCPKGGKGYWNKIRQDFPEVFDRMAQLQRRLVSAAFWKEADGSYLYLDQLAPDRGDHRNDPSIECSLLCVIAEQDMNATTTN